MDNAVAETKPRRPFRIIGIILVGIAVLVVLGLGWYFWPRTSFGYQGSISSDAPLEGYPPVRPTEVDFPAPDLILRDLEGKSASLGNYRGKVILVNIWAIWCTPCRVELPILQEYYAKHQYQDFVVIGIEAGDEVEDILYHVKLFKLTFPNWQDPDKVASAAFTALYLPSSFVIDRSGRVRLTWSGAADRETLEDYLTPLLEK
jgi:cytochrome c biogenesis protein CcmG, thiol:disulfide interchange protein DsbE